VDFLVYVVDVGTEQHSGEFNLTHLEKKVNFALCPTMENAYPFLMKGEAPVLMTSWQMEMKK
jgi:hypothetical protein